MDALRSTTEGSPSPNNRSFLDVLSGTSTEPFNPKKASLFRGKPAVAFSTEDVRRYSAPFRFALIGKFSKGRPSLENIRKGFREIGFLGTYTIGHIDSRHIIIKFDKEEDYIRCFLRRVWTIDGFLMRMLKWNYKFHVDSEPSVVPVWVSFPSLPLHFYNKEALYSIACLVGEPLKLDASTSAFTRPSVARICVELDLQKERAEEVYIINGDVGFWQRIIYENLPDYCATCYRVGHPMERCRSLAFRNSADGQPLISKKTDVPAPKHPPRMEYRIKQSATVVSEPSDAAALGHKTHGCGSVAAANGSAVLDAPLTETREGSLLPVSAAGASIHVNEAPKVAAVAASAQTSLEADQTVANLVAILEPLVADPSVSTPTNTAAVAVSHTEHPAAVASAELPVAAAALSPTIGRPSVSAEAVSQPSPVFLPALHTPAAAAAAAVVFPSASPVAEARPVSGKEAKEKSKDDIFANFSTYPPFPVHDVDYIASDNETLGKSRFDEELFSEQELELLSQVAKVKTPPKIHGASPSSSACAAYSEIASQRAGSTIMSPPVPLDDIFANFSAYPPLPVYAEDYIASDNETLGKSRYDEELFPKFSKQETQLLSQDATVQTPPKIQEASTSSSVVSQPTLEIVLAHEVVDIAPLAVLHDDGASCYEEDNEDFFENEIEIPQHTDLPNRGRGKKKKCKAQSDRVLRQRRNNKS